MNITIDQEINSNDKILKISIWIYLILWIFEGALRKWILPSLAAPLLIVRDPLAIYIMCRAIYLNIKFFNVYVVLSMLFTLFGLAITLTFGHGNLFVAIYGARIMFLHFPLIFIIGAVLTKEDVQRIGRFLLGINILMTIIVYFQFISPQTAFINIGIGGEGSAGFSGAMGYSRPPGTFSFTSGLSIFYAAVSVFVFYFWLSKAHCSKILLVVSTLTLIIALPLTISRGAIVAVVIVGLFAVIASVTSSKMILKVIVVSILFYFFIIILQQYSTIFNLGSNVLMNRVTTANNATAGGGLKDSIFLRIFNDLISPFYELFKKPLFAGNLGMGTNAGAQLLKGKVTFLVAETEFGRLGGEQGIIFGGGLILLRTFLAISLAFRSIKLPHEQKLLPFILCGAACTAIFQGQWAQPTVLGYAIIMAGLVLASLKNDSISEQKA